jgi:hypothetical protein
MHLTLRHFRFFRELIIVFILFFVYNNFLYKKELDRHEVVINSDGRGYYEYLPAFFIYDDIHLAYIDTLKTEYYEIENNKAIYGYLENGQRINKYYSGTALLQAPFFYISHLIASSKNSHHLADGYSLPYQKGIWYGAIFYLFLGMICIRLLLQTYQLNGWWIFIIQLSLLFATPLLNYTVYDSAYSHVYSFFLIGWFLYTTRKYFVSDNSGHLILSLVIFGLIAIVRPINVVVILFTPLLVESAHEYLKNVKSIFQKHLIPFLVGLICFGLIVSIQLYISFLQSGNPLNYNYGEEGFNFMNPHFVSFLFSYHKGFFLWTPFWVIVFLMGTIYWIFQKKQYQLFIFISTFIVLAYILSSWHAWSYGASIGSRPMIDFYSVFCLLFVPVFSSRNNIGKIILVFILPIASIVMQIQTYQYQRAIIHWDGMDQQKYWEVFLNTNEKYSWYFWRTDLPIGKEQNKTLIYQGIQVPKNAKQLHLPVVDITIIDSLSHYGKLELNLNREADNEFMEIVFMDSLNQQVHYSLQRFFVNNNGTNKVVYKFELPDEKIHIRKLKLVLQKIDEPLTIDSISFSAHYSLNY